MSLMSVFDRQVVQAERLCAIRFSLTKDFLDEDLLHDAGRLYAR